MIQPALHILQIFQSAVCWLLPMLHWPPRRLPHATPAGLVRDMLRCPFGTSPLPLPGQAIGEDPRMVSIYLHEATLNCLLWGLYSSGL